ncbi:hypothetical protein ACRARG_12480 [Pseudooceanicola sp. C21-150M6]|uniref:hypothetical protein n=1 Tax=Pseudooceanicola sp. C21-150M6 TaxID=3434355 RepID=UPI003D7F6E5B
MTFQKQAHAWAVACFGEEIAADKSERAHRFLEEALELAQAGGCTASEAHQLVDYVFGRPEGDLSVEIGDVMNTLAIFGTAHGIDIQDAADIGLERCWANIEKTRAKRAGKPSFSPLPE